MSYYRFRIIEIKVCYEMQENILIYSIITLKMPVRTRFVLQIHVPVNVRKYYSISHKMHDLQG